MINPKFFRSAPIAIKQQPNAIAGLLGAKIDLNPLKKNLLLIINHQGIIYQHQGFLVNHPLCQQLRFVQILKHNLYLQTLIPFWHFVLLK